MNYLIISVYSNESYRHTIYHSFIWVNNEVKEF